MAIARVITIGRVGEQKDPAWFAQLAKTVRSSDKDIEFLWIGGGEPGLVRELQGNGVPVTGWLTKGEALRQLRSGDIYVHSAAWEGFPMTVLETVNRGIPVLVRKIPCFEDVPAELAGTCVADVATSVLQIAGDRSGSNGDRNVQQWRTILAGHTVRNQRMALEELYDHKSVAVSA